MFATKLSPRSWKVYADCQITSVCKLGLLVYSPAPEYFSPVGCHKMAFCPQIKEQKTLSCLPLASEMYRHSMALNSTCRGRDKISHLKKFKFVFLRASQWSLAGGRGQLVFRATEIARTMIIAIVTSREAEPGKSKWLTNNDLAKSFSCRFSQAIRNMAMKKQKIHGILLIYCPKNTIYISKNKPFKVRKHADFEIGQLKTRQ